VFRVRCSSGTYVRSLARDLGEALGVGAHLTALRRTAIGRFGVDGALSQEALSDPEAVRRAALTPLAALGHLPVWEVGPDVAERLAHGQRIPYPDGASDALMCAANAGRLVAVGSTAGGVFRPTKVFV